MSFYTEEDLAHFMSITGADSSTATHYLEASGFDVDNAVNMFFEFGGANLGGSGATGAPRDTPVEIPEEETVRAPIAPQRATLVEPSAALPGIVARGLQRQPEKYQSAFGPSSRDASARPEDSDKLTFLAELFAPPTDLIFAGSFEEIKETASSSMKWIMINIMDPSEFQCEVQNRDLWKDRFVKEVVKANFIFSQIGCNTEAGKRFRQFYPVENYPHISILDPRTEERLAKWEFAVTPSQFIELVSDFLENHSLTENYIAPTPQKPQPSTKSIDSLTEEEQLEAALRASLEGATSTTAAISEPKVEASSSTAVAPAPAPSAHPSLQVTPAALPTLSDTAENSTKVAVRLLDGQRVMLRLLKSDPVRAIFAHLRATVPALSSSAFEIMAQRDRLSEKLDQSIEEAGLANALITVSPTD